MRRANTSWYHLVSSSSDLCYIDTLLYVHICLYVFYGCIYKHIGAISFYSLDMMPNFISIACYLSFLFLNSVRIKRMIRELFYDRTTVARNPLNLIGFLFPEFYDALEFFVNSLVIILFFCAFRNDENQLAMQVEAKEPAVSTDKQTELSSIQRTDTAVFPQTISKVSTL